MQVCTSSFGICEQDTLFLFPRTFEATVRTQNDSPVNRGRASGFAGV